MRDAASEIPTQNPGNLFNPGVALLAKAADMICLRTHSAAGDSFALLKGDGMSMTCGEATMRLLADYGVTTVFGASETCALDGAQGPAERKSAGGPRYSQGADARGAVFMASGLARASGAVGVALVQDGPGVAEAVPALAQGYADSLPMLLISVIPAGAAGLGVADPARLTAAMTAFSADARDMADIPQLLSRAFSLFSSQRPRPVHIALPADLLAELLPEAWQPTRRVDRAEAAAGKLPTAAAMLKEAARPVIILGGGAVEAAGDLQKVIQRCGAVVISTPAGKGIIPDDHPLHLAGALGTAQARDYLSGADVVLALGTELATTGAEQKPLTLNGDLIRIDLDPGAIHSPCPAALGIIGDAAAAMADLAAFLADHDCRRVTAQGTAAVAELRVALRADLPAPQQGHLALLDMVRDLAPEQTLFAGDPSALVEAGALGLAVRKPRQWLASPQHPALGSAVPVAVGAGLGKPKTPIVVLTTLAGLRRAVPDLTLACELGLPLPVIVSGAGDLSALAAACGAEDQAPTTRAEFETAFKTALTAEHPVLIAVPEEAGWSK
jgi:thiamine pyrophosphate-dependent acetolactate synthase large subunit-like protein